MATPYLGEIRLLPYTFAPAGWIDCNGSLLGIAQNTALFALLGTAYGGDGVTTFGVPDLRGRVPLHQGNGLGLTQRSLGELGGSESVTLLPTQMPTHNHAFIATSGAATSATPGPDNRLGGTSPDTLYTSDVSDLTSRVSASTMTAPTGGSLPHDNCMPTLAVRFCMATEGVFPSRG